MEKSNFRQLSAQKLPRPIDPISGHEEKANGRSQCDVGQHKVEPKFWHRRKQRGRFRSSSSGICKRATRRTGSVPIVAERATRRTGSVPIVVTRLCPPDRVARRAPSNRPTERVRPARRSRSALQLGVRPRVQREERKARSPRRPPMGRGMPRSIFPT